VLQVPVWLAATAVGGCESVQPFRLQAEVRQSDAEAYEMVSDTDWQTEPGTYRLQLPQAAEPDPNKPFARKPVFRLRLSHKGAHDPQLKLGVEGI
jgi:hypothetical protein